MSKFMPFDKSEEKSTALFNAGIGGVQRLHELLNDANRFSRLCTLEGLDIENLKLWYNTIRAFYREISSKLAPDEIRSVEKKFASLKEIGKISIPTNTPNGRVLVVDPKKFHESIIVFDSIERQLRRIADVKELLIPNKKGGWGAFEG